MSRVPGLSSSDPFRPKRSPSHTPVDILTTEWPWADEPTVFANYAKHYQTGAPMPAALVAKIKNSQTFNQGFSMTEILAALNDEPNVLVIFNHPLWDLFKIGRQMFKKADKAQASSMQLISRVPCEGTSAQGWSQ